MTCESEGVQIEAGLPLPECRVVEGMSVARFDEEAGTTHHYCLAGRGGQTRLALCLLRKINTRRGRRQAK